MSGLYIKGIDLESACKQEMNYFFYWKWGRITKVIGRGDSLTGFLFNDKFVENTVT